MEQTTVEQTETTQSGEGISEQKTESQDSQQVSQDTATSQNPETVEVENSPASQTSQFDRRPSAFYKVRQLEKQIKQMTEAITKLTASKSETNNPVKQDSSIDDSAEEGKLLKNPIPYLRNMIENERKLIREQLLQEIREKEIPTLFEKIESQKSYESKAREAWKLIFPNLDFSKNESLEEIQQKDPNRFKTVQDVWDEYGLEYVFQNDPTKAAKKTLEILEWKKSQAKRTPLVPTKAQMGSTSSGTPIGGNSATNIDSLKQKAEKLGQRLSDDPSLLQDEKFMKDWEAIKEAVSNHKDK